MATGHSRIGGSYVGNSEGHASRAYFDLGGGVYVTTGPDIEPLGIHVRKYDRGVPTQRGAVLSLEQWSELRDQRFLVDEFLQTIERDKQNMLTCHLGSHLFVEVNKACQGVDLRHWDWNSKTKSVLPSKKGILLSVEQWEKLKICIDTIQDFELNYTE